MSRRLALGIVVAFCAALCVGRFVFQAAPQALPETEPAWSAVNSVAVSAPEGVVAPEIEHAKAMSKAMQERGIDTELQVVDHGVLNENTRMSHFLANDVLEGTLHSAKNHFDEKVRWIPQAQELRNGETVTAILATTTSSRGKIEKVNGSSRMVYTETYPATDERMYVRPEGGVEHDFILKQIPSNFDDLSSLAYTGVLQLSPGLTLWDGKTQITGKYKTSEGIQIKNTFGNTVFFLRRPIAYDSKVMKEDGTFDAKKQAKQENSHCFTGLEYHVDFDDSGVRLSIVTPGKWLKDPARSYPVVIDPNLGPFGLQDGDPPVYVGAAGSDTLIPAIASGTKMGIIARAGDDPNICSPKMDNGYGIIPMPFAFTFYGVLHLPGSPLFTHIDGFASWQCPWETCRPLVPPATSACFDTDNTALPQPGYPWDGFFPYWDDLKFGPPANGTDPGSGIYFFTDGVAPNRRLIIEWNRMQYAGSPNPTDIISFNLVLYECQNKIQFIIGRPNDKDLGRASVGIENRSGSLGIQYCFNGILQTPPQPPITPGTSVAFEPSRASTIAVTPLMAAGCTPLEVCFNSTVTPPPTNCGTGPSITPSLGFRWIFDSARAPDIRLDRAEAFTEDVCHTFVIPARYRVTLEVTDEFGAKTRIFRDVSVCDKPEVIIAADPQGGYAPLIVNFEARTPSDPNLLLSGSAAWSIEQLGLNVEPGQSAQVATLNGNVVGHRFDNPGIFKTTAVFNGTDQATGLATSGVGTIFIFVANSADVIEDGIIITESKLKIDWAGKADGPDADGLPPNVGSTVPGQGLPDRPDNDTLYIKGFINLPGISQSGLTGRLVRVILNGIDPILEGRLDASGTVVNGDKATGQIAQFSIKQPSGAFFCTTKGNLFGSLALNNITERRLLPAHYRVEIEGLFPTAQLGPIITYDYQSTAFKSAKGAYKFGMFTKDGAISGLNNPTGPQVPVSTPGVPIGTGNPGGQTLLVSGAFFVTDAVLTLEGNSFFADIKGFLSRFGGDDLRPSANSDVVVSIGGFSEALNFTTTPTFKTSGRPPAQKFSFKSAGALGNTGIASMQWVNRAGSFQIKTFAIPNEKVGINTALDVQAMTLGLIITPENAQQFNATARFELAKAAPDKFVRTSKQK